MAATAWVAGGDMAFATEFGVDVSNVATVSYSVVGETTTVATNEAVFTIRPPASPAIIEFFRFSPNADDKIFRAINGTDFSPSGSLNGPFSHIGDPVTAGGQLIDLSGDIPLTPATTYLAGELMFIRVIDTGQNLDSSEIDTLVITVVADNGDEITLRLYETGPDTGEFFAYMPSTPVPTPLNDGVMSAGENTQLTATYIDVFDATDVTVDTAIVNPLNRVFSSITGDPIDGAVVTLINLDTGQEATVYGVDGFSAFPSEVISGETTTDTSGLVYEMGDGQFRYPILDAGRYEVRVDPPEGYRFSSVVEPDQLSFNKPGQPGFVILNASFGGEYVLDEAGPLRFDIPLDPESDLVVTKTADRTYGDVGDFINYTVKIENRGQVSAPVMLYDTLPIGFQYVPGTSKVARAHTSDPTVSDDSTLLTFPMGTIGAGETIILDYALEIGAGAALGDAINEAVIRDANGDQLSNIGRAAIRLREDLLRSRSTIVGRISQNSCDGDEDWAREIRRGTGVKDVRLYMETGAYVVSDADGLFHFEGVTEGTHVVQVDEETLPQGFELMACEENTRYAGAMNSKFIDVQGGGIWRANFYLKQTGAVEEVKEEQVFNDKKEYKKFDQAWLDQQDASVEWVYPETDRTPSGQSVNIGIKHAPGQSMTVTVNGRKVEKYQLAEREMNGSNTVMLSRWRSINIVDGHNDVVVTVRDADGQIVKELKKDIYFASKISRATALPDQSVLIADGRSVPVIAIRMEDDAGRPVHSGRITTVEVETPFRLFDETGENRLIEQTHDLVAPLSARREFSVGADGILNVKLEPTLKTGKVTVIATMDNGRRVPIYMYMKPEKRDWILVGLAEGGLGYEDISGNAVALGETTGKDVIKDGRVAFFAKGLIKGNWLMTLSLDTDTRKGTRDGDFGEEIDPNAYYTLYGDRSYQQFDGTSRYPVFVKLEKAQAYALFGDYETNISEGRLTSYHRRLSGLKAEYIGDKFQVLGFAAETNQGFIKDEIAADGTSGTYQLSNGRILAQSENIVVETRDRFRPDIVLERKTMVRYLDYTLDYLTGQLIFRLPVNATDPDFNPKVIVVDYETSEDAERNITFGGRVQTQILDDKVQIGSTFVHENGSALQGGAKQNQVGIDMIAQVSDSTQIRAEYAVTENKGAVKDTMAEAYLAEIVHTSEKLSGEAYFRQEDEGYGLGQTGSNTTSARRYGVKANYKISQFEDEKTGLRGHRRIEGQAFREENLSTGNARNTAEVLVSHEGQRLGLAAGLRASKDELVSGEDRQSVVAIARSSIRIPKHDATIQISHEQPLGGKDEVSAHPQRTTIGIDKNLGKSTTASIRHELLDGAFDKSQNTTIGLTTSPWKGSAITASSDLLTNDSGRRLGATVGLDQQFQIDENWSVSTGVRNRKVLDKKGADIDILPDAAISPIEVDEDFTSAYLGAAYRDDVMSGSTRVEARRSSEGELWIASAGVARELSDKLSLAGSARGMVNDPKSAERNNSQLDVRLGGAWRPRGEETIVFDRLDINRTKDATGLTKSKIVNNLAVNQMVTDRLQATVNYGVKHVSVKNAGESLKSFNQLLGGEARYDITKKIDIGLRGSMLHSSSSNTMKYSYGPSIGVSPVKNVWLSAGYNVSGYKDEDFEAAEYSRKGVYLQMRLKFDQHTARGLLRRISPASTVGPAGQPQSFSAPASP